MSTPIFVITEANEPIPEAAIKGNFKHVNRPAFYTLTTPEGQVYAGSTGSINNRLAKHKSDLNKGKHSYPQLQDAVNSGHPIKVKVEYVSDRENAYKAEQTFINKNIGTPVLLNKAVDVKKPCTQPRSEETKQKLRQALAGKPQTPERIEKQKEAMKGHEVSLETRNKISEALKGRPFPPSAKEAARLVNSKSVMCDGKVYPSYAEASRDLGVSDMTIRRRIASPDPKFSQYATIK